MNDSPFGLDSSDLLRDNFDGRQILCLLIAVLEIWRDRDRDG